MGTRDRGAKCAARGRATGARAEPRPQEPRKRFGRPVAEVAERGVGWKDEGSWSPSSAVVVEYDGAADYQDGEVSVLRPGLDPDLVRTDGLVATNHFVLREPPETSGSSFERH